MLFLFFEKGWEPSSSRLQCVIYIFPALMTPSYNLQFIFITMQNTTMAVVVGATTFDVLMQTSDSYTWSLIARYKKNLVRINLSGMSQRFLFRTVWCRFKKWLYLVHCRTNWQKFLSKVLKFIVALAAFFDWIKCFLSK